jgi:Domain of unknown function (DUF4371)
LLQLLALQAAISPDPITKFKYNHDRYIARLSLALSEYCLRSTVQAAKESPYFTIITDLSSDIADHENMVLFIRYWDKATFAPVTQYLSCVQLIGKDGASMSTAIRQVCKALGLPLQPGLIALCADGDPAMQGHITGLLGDLRTTCHHVLGHHCAAHRHVLAMNDNAKTNFFLKLLDSLLMDAYNLMNRKPKMVALWELYASKHGVTALKFKKFNVTRWWSRAACIRMLVACLPQLLSFLYAMSRPSAKFYWPAAEVFRQQLKNPVSLVVLFYCADLMDVLESSRKIFESTGCSLLQLKGEQQQAVSLLQEFASETEPIESMTGRNMLQLRCATDNFAVKAPTYNIHASWKGTKHSFECDLCGEVLPIDMADSLRNIPRGLMQSLQERFPAKELDMLNSLSCVDARRYAGLSPTTAQKQCAGEPELKALIKFLQTERSDAQGSQYWASKPLIEDSIDKV